MVQQTVDLLIRGELSLNGKGGFTSPSAFICRAATACDAFKKAFNLLGTACKAVTPEVVSRVFNQLDERD